MSAAKITPDELDGLESYGFRFGWRARLIATGEPLSDEEFRELWERHRLWGGNRTWEIEHVVSWPQPRPGDPRAEAMHELQKLYETNERVREEFASADSRRALENGWTKESSLSTE
jgi:hypothetical protein